MSFLQNLFLFLILAVAPARLWAQQVTATVEPRTVRPGQSFILSIAVTSDGSVSAEQPELPDLSNFQVRNAFSSSETRSVFQNGKFQVSRSQVFNYELMPTSPGTFTIAPVSVVVNGQVLKTEPVTVEVTQNAPPSGGQAIPGDGDEQEDPYSEMDDMFQQLLRRRLDRLQKGGRGNGANPGAIVSPADLNDAFYVEVEVDKTKVYVGEQVTVTWYLVTRAQIADIDTLKYPAVSGFWREDIELATRLNFKPEVINGVTYNKALLASFALFPIKAGTSKIDAYTARCNVVAIGNFGATNQQLVTKSSQEVPITVLPLPEEGKPENFTGAVGEFQMNSKVDSTNPILSNAPFEFKVRFEGRGNAKNIDAPKLELPEGLELYDTKNETKFFIDGRSYKEFNYVLVARNVGELIIPSVTASFFNQIQKKYYMQTTDPIKINVGQGDTSGPIDSKPLAAEEIQNRKPVLPALALQMRESGEWTMSAKLGSWSVLLLFGLVFVGYRGFVEFRSSEKRESLAKMVKAKFKEIDNLTAKGEMRNAAVEATNLVYLILGELSGLGGASRQMSVLLEKSPPSYRREVGESLDKTMRKLEVLAFAPAELSGTNKNEQKALLKEVEKLLRKSLDYNFETDDQSSKG